MKLCVYGQVWCFFNISLINTYTEKHDSEIIPLLTRNALYFGIILCVHSMYVN